MVLPWVLCGVLAVAVIVLCVNIHMIRVGIGEIRAKFAEILYSDTNTLITVSTSDRKVLRLAADINKQLRLLRAQRLKYENGSRELTDAVTNISHDLRTPLTAICGYLELLEKEEKSDSVSRYLAAIQNRAEVLKQLTEELFKYSVIISVKEAPELSEQPLNGILEESLAGFYGEFTKRGISPEIGIPEEKVTRRVNRNDLLRVFGNILSNAARYGGDLRVELRVTGETVFSNSSKALSEVQVGKLFDRFFTVESARNSTGLGLSIAKTLTERMGGQISAGYSDGRLSVTVFFPPEDQPEHESV